MRISRSRDAPSASDTANAWDILRRAFALILNIDGANTELSFEELYRHVCSMVSARRGSELYQGVRHLVAEHVQQLAQKIIEESDGTDTENVETIPLVVICRAWFPMSKKLELLRGILTFCERIYEPTIGAEPIHQFGWKTFLAEVLENPAVKQKMALSPWLMAEPMRQRQQLNRLVVQRNMLGVGPHDFVESQRFCSDIIIDSLSFLSTPLLGLKCAPVCRQLTFLSDYVLNRRSRVLSPFVISHEEDESGGSRTRGHLLERSKQDFNKYTISTVVGPLDLPDTEPPPWVAGIDTIYLEIGRRPNKSKIEFGAGYSISTQDDCITADAMALLHSLQPMLQHCNVVMDLFILQHWAAQPDKAELIASFLRFFGSNCCFAIHHHQATYYPARGGELRASLQLPLWALFNDLMLTGCRQLELLAQLLSNAQLGLDAAKWLLHESTATRPRRLKLYSNDETYWEHQQREAARGVTPMVKQLKEEFMQSQQKRRFFVDFPTGRGVNHQQDLGVWFNGVSEQLQITQNRIRRVSAGEELKEFEDFYDQLKTGVQPKINIIFFGQF